MDWLNYSFDDDIVKCVTELQRTYGRVFPYMVVSRLQLRRAEGTLRRDMLRLAQCGRLERIGGYHARQGYRVVPVVKVVDFRPITPVAA